MARKRMIDPNIWQSEDFAELSSLAKLVWIGMFSNADDYGKGRAKPVYLKSVIFPYEEGIRVSDIDKTLSEIGSKMSVTFYSHDGNQYYRLDNWNKWQKVDRPRESTIPDPARDIFDDCSTIHRRRFDDESPPNIIEQNKNITEQNKNIAHGAKEFENFWQAYPRQIGKRKAEAAFITASKSVDAELIIVKAKEYAEWCERNQQEPQYIAHPTTWLNQGRWDDVLVDKVTPKSDYDKARDERKSKQDEAFDKLIAMSMQQGGGDDGET